MMKVALFGISHWHAQMHLDAVRSAGADVMAVWDRDAETAAAFSRKFGVPALPDVMRVLDASPDLAVVMGHPLHVRELALHIIDAGVPMVLEKPAAVSTQALTPVVERARAKNHFVSVPFPNRFGPVFPEMRRLEAEKRLGALAHAHFRIVNGPPERYRVDHVAWMLDPQVAGGGVLRNLGIHGIDAVLSLARGKVSIRSAAISSCMHHENVEDYVLAVLSDEAGTLFTVESGYTYASMEPGGDFEWRLATGNAYLVDTGECARCVTLDDGVVRSLTPEHPATRYRLCMADAIDCLRRGVPPGVGIDDYAAAMHVIDTLYERGTS